MQEESLLDELERYQPFDELEGAHVAATINFMRDYENCFERSNLHGHITGSGWIINTRLTHCLLVHHRKLSRWLQPGGHADGNGNVMHVAEMEVSEETGLETYQLIPGIFDVDVHRIPARKSDPEHYHFDIRYLFMAELDAPLRVSSESNALRWISMDQLHEYTGDEASMVRLLKKSYQLNHHHLK